MQPDPTLEHGADIEIRLGETKPFANWEVKVHAESEALGDRLRSRLLALGFRDDGLQIVEPDRDQVKYGGATPFARQVVRWLLSEEGIQVHETKEWGDDDDDIWVYAKDPTFAGKSVRERYPVEIHVDDYERVFVLKERLEAAGFTSRCPSALSMPRGAPQVHPQPTGPMEKDPEAVARAGGVVPASSSRDQEVDDLPLPAGGDRVNRRVPRPRTDRAAHRGDDAAARCGRTPERSPSVGRSCSAPTT